MLALRELPQHLVVLGGGVIGLEMATYYAMADVDTTVVEMQDHIGGPSDRDMVKILQKNCEAEGMHFLLNAKVTEIREGSVIYEQGGKTCTLPADKVLLSIGRKPNTAGIGLENVGVLTERGAIVTDERMQTNVPGIYAVGDAQWQSHAGPYRISGSGGRCQQYSRKTRPNALSGDSQRPIYSAGAQQRR